MKNLVIILERNTLNGKLYSIDEAREILHQQVEKGNQIYQTDLHFPVIMIENCESSPIKIQSSFT